MNVVSMPGPKSHLAPDAAEKLRELADLADRGEVTSMVVAYAGPNGYSFVWPSSLTDSLVLSNLVHDQALKRMRE